MTSEHDLDAPKPPGGPQRTDEPEGPETPDGRDERDAPSDDQGDEERALQEENAETSLDQPSS